MILRCQLREEYPDFVHTGQTVWMLGVECHVLQFVPDAQAYQVLPSLWGVFYRGNGYSA